MKKTLTIDNTSELMENIKINHRLLCRTGVVPGPVQELVARIEKAGGAAKISGAGSVRGDSAGVLLVTGPFENMQTAFGFRLNPLRGVDHGAGII